MKLIGRLLRLFSTRADSGRVDEPSSATHEITDEDVPHESDVDPFNPFPEPIRLEITDVLDLHAFSPRDVRRVVEAYLEEARRAGFRQVRIIHGKGVGVQREMVRSILARAPFVEHFADAPAEAGGWGATIACLSISHRDTEAQSS